MAWAITIGLANRTEDVVSVAVSKSITSRASCTLEAQSTDGSWSPSVGQPVKVAYESATKFVGTIESVRTSWTEGDEVLRHSIQCASYDQIAARRIVDAPLRLDRGGAGAMFEAIVTRYLGGEDMSSTVATGPTIGPVDIGTDIGTVEAALDRLAELSGMYWDIVGEPGLPEFRAFVRGTYSAPAEITDETTECRARVEVTRTRQDYANRVYARIASGAGAQTAHDQYGNGSTRSFEIPSRASQVVAVNVDGDTKSFALQDSGTTADYYWQPGSTTITQDDAGTILTSSQLLSVSYLPVEDILVLGAANAGQVTARQTVEGGSGQYETIIDVAEGSVLSSAEEAAAKHLDSRDDLPVAVSVTVEARGDYAGLDIAQTLDITLPALGVSGSWLVETMEIATSAVLDADGVPIAEYTLVCSTGGAATSDWRRTLAEGWGAAGTPAIAGSGGSPSAGGVYSVALNGDDEAVIDMANGETQEIILDRATITILNPTHGMSGQKLRLVLTQDSDASRDADGYQVATWGAAYFGASDNYLDGAAGTCAVFVFICLGVQWICENNPVQSGLRRS